MQYDKKIGEGWDKLLKNLHFSINWPTTVRFGIIVNCELKR